MSEFIYEFREKNTINGIYQNSALSILSMLKKLIESEEFSFDYHNIEFLPEKGEFYEFGIVSPPSFYKSFKEMKKEPRVPDDANENNIVSFYQNRFKKCKDLEVNEETFLYEGDSFPDFETEVFRLSTLIENSSKYQDFMKPYLTIEFFANTKRKTSGFQHVVAQYYFQIDNIDDRLKYLKRFINTEKDIKSNTKVGMVNNFKLNNNSLYTSFTDPKKSEGELPDESIYEDSIPSGGHDFSLNYNTSPTSIKELVTDKKYCGYDVIGYIITKTKGSDENKKVVKRVFVLNDYENGYSGPVKFFDSQIKEEENYQYSIHQIINIYGKTFTSDKFKYEKGANAKPKDFFVDGNVEPEAIFAEELATPFAKREDDIILPFYRNDDFFVNTSLKSKNKEMSVYSPLSFEKIDSPNLNLNTKIFQIKPSSPDVNIYAKKGESKNVLILISSLVGAKETVTGLLDVGKTEVKIIDLGFGLESLVFPIKEYHVYRTEEEPTSYASFPSEPRKIVYPRNPDFLDDIEPNTEYYYYAKAIDTKGIESDPSKILKLEMVQEQDHIFALLETYKLGNKKEQVTEKMFKKTLAVSPTFLQSAVKDNIVGGYINTKFKLFANSARILDPIIKPTHKLRVTSKKTRRRFDINVIYSYKEIEDFKELPPGAELVLEEPLGPLELTEEEVKKAVQKGKEASEQLEQLFQNVEDAF